MHECKKAPQKGISTMALGHTVIFARVGFSFVKFTCAAHESGNLLSVLEQFSLNGLQTNKQMKE